MVDNLELIKIFVEIGILWFSFYFILLFVRHTHGVQVLKGIIFLALFFIVTKGLELDTINWISTKLFAISVIAFLIIFQPELRRGLANIGQRTWTGMFFKGEVTNEIVKVSISLSNKKIGGIIAIERDSKLTHYVESGIELDAKVKAETLLTIFMPNTPLHDGGVIISGDRIVAAGCLFPLTQNPNISKTMGTRHMAGLGLSEETDAIVVVISEETGEISIASNGKFTQGLNSQSLEQVLNELCGLNKCKKMKSILQ